MSLNTRTTNRRTIVHRCLILSRSERRCWSSVFCLIEQELIDKWWTTNSIRGQRFPSLIFFEINRNNKRSISIRLLEPSMKESINDNYHRSISKRNHSSETQLDIRIHFSWYSFCFSYRFAWWVINYILLFFWFLPFSFDAVQTHRYVKIDRFVECFVNMDLWLMRTDVQFANATKSNEHYRIFVQKVFLHWKIMLVISKRQ